MTRQADFRKRVAIAGFGVVGRSVFSRLAANPAAYEVVGILCRNPAQHRDSGAAAQLLVSDPAALPQFDILIEAIGGIAPADAIALGALARGCDVISANKTLVSRRYADLRRAASASGGRLFYSAAVGGGAPMLETIDARAGRPEIIRIEAVLNGTTNFVLDRIGAGLAPSEAIRLAQEAGFAEADPAADIDGVDAAEKLSLLARHAFRADIDPDDIARDRLFDIAAGEIRAAQSAGTPYKQIASAWRTPAGLAFEVRLRRTAVGDPLGKPRLEENCLVISDARGGREIVFGKGAGGEPTADSIVSDLRALEISEPVEAQV